MAWCEKSRLKYLLKAAAGRNFSFMHLRLLDFLGKNNARAIDTRTRSLILRPRSRLSIRLRRSIFAAYVFAKNGKLRQHCAEKPCPARCAIISSCLNLRSRAGALQKRRCHTNAGAEAGACAVNADGDGLENTNVKAGEGAGACAVNADEDGPDSLNKWPQKRCCTTGGRATSAASREGGSARFQRVARHW